MILAVKHKRLHVFPFGSNEYTLLYYDAYSDGIITDTTHHDINILGVINKGNEHLPGLATSW